MCLSALSAYMHSLLRPKVSIRIPVTRATDGCEQPCSHWDSYPGPLKSGIHSYPLRHLSRLSPDFPKPCYMDKDSFKVKHSLLDSRKPNHQSQSYCI